MKNFNEYIDEKLKLSDISKMKSSSQWVDARTLKYDDLQEGYVLEVRKGVKYVIAPTENVQKFMSFSIIGNGKYSGIRKSNDKYGSIILRRYKDTFPIEDHDSSFDVLRVYKNNKKFTDKKDLIEYLNFINNLK